MNFTDLLGSLKHYINNVPAMLTLTNVKAATGNPAQSFVGYDLQTGIGGTIAFTSLNAINIGSRHFAAGRTS